MRRLLIGLLLALPASAAEYRLDQRVARTWGSDRSAPPSAEAPAAGLEIAGVGAIDVERRGDRRSFQLSAPRPAHAIEEPFAGGRMLRIRDVNDRTIAIVEQHLSRSPDLLPSCMLVVKDPTGRELARSDTQRGLRPGFTLREASGVLTSLRASGERQVRWKISHEPGSDLDPRVLWMIAAARTQACTLALVESPPVLQAFDF